MDHNRRTNLYEKDQIAVTALDMMVKPYLLYSYEPLVYSISSHQNVLLGQVPTEWQSFTLTFMRISEQVIGLLLGQS